MLAVLAGIEQVDRAFDSRSSALFIGTSAGSIVAAALAAGLEPRARLGGLPGAQAPGPSATKADASGAGPAGARSAFGRAAGLASIFTGPLASAALTTSAVPGALLRRGLLRGLTPGTRSLRGLAARIDREDVRFDGRLLVVAVEQSSGRRVAFGSRGAPTASVGKAVEASCAIPGFFEPVSIEGRRYVDGGVWSPTNMDLARARRGEEVWCLNPTGSLRPSASAPAGAIGPVSRTIAAAEAAALRARGARVRTVNPDRDSVAAMGVNLMNPSRRAAVIDAGLAQGRELGLTLARKAA